MVERGRLGAALVQVGDQMHVAAHTRMLQAALVELETEKCRAEAAIAESRAAKDREEVLEAKVKMLEVCSYIVAAGSTPLPWAHFPVMLHLSYRMVCPSIACTDWHRWCWRGCACPHPKMPLSLVENCHTSTQLHMADLLCQC